MAGGGDKELNIQRNDALFESEVEACVSGVSVPYVINQNNGKVYEHKNVTDRDVAWIKANERLLVEYL